jgi:hypothetical protein
MHVFKATAWRSSSFGKSVLVTGRKIEIIRASSCFLLYL